jgi:oligopeptide transport system substrate-binding protein
MKKRTAPRMLRPLLALSLPLLLIVGGCSGSKSKDSGGGAGSTGESVASANGGDGSTATSAGGEKVLKDGYVLAIGNPPHFDPALNFTVEGATIITQVWDGLTEFDFSDPKKPILKPNAAEKYEANADASEFTFTLRKDAKFSNGNAVLPSSFAYAWNRASDPKMAATYAYLFYFIKGGKDRVDGKSPNIAGVVADDAALTLKVTLDKPYADFPAIITHNVFFPLDEKTVSKLPDQTKYEQGVMIGNGPFKMAGPYEKDRGISLVQNENYAGGVVGAENGKLNPKKPNLTRIDFVVSKDLDTAYQAFESGQSDMGGIPSGKFKEATAKYPFFQQSAFTIDYYVFNFDDPIVGGTKNEKLRQAMSLAIDRQAIVDATCQGSCILATSIVPPGIPGHLDGLCEICGRDMAKAKKLFDEWKSAGGTLSAPIDLAFNSGAGSEDVVNIMQANLAELGIDVKQRGISSDTYFQDMAKQPAQFFRLGWAADYPLYYNFAGDLFSTGSANNYSKINLPEFDAALAKARATPDEAGRLKTYQAAERLVVNTGYALPIQWGNGGFVHSKRVKGAVRYPSLMVNYDLMDIG